MSLRTFLLKISLCAVLFFNWPLLFAAQVNIASSSPDIVAPANDVAPAKAEPPRKFSRSRDIVESVPLLSWQSVALSIVVLSFGTYVVTLQYKLLLASKSQPLDSIKGLTVTTIVVLALAIVSSSFGVEQMTPVLGLFGTIIGYLLGSGGRQGAVSGGTAGPKEPAD